MWLLVWLWLFPCQVSAALISEIRFEGNEVTKEEVLRQELLVEEGDEADEGRIERSRQAIMNLGLFKSVTSRIEDDEWGKRVVFIVEERFYILPIPRLGAKAKNDNVAEGLGSYSYGVELRYDNVMGLNHRLKLVREKEQESDIGQTLKRETSLSYSIPRLLGSPYSVSTKVKEVTLDTRLYEGESRVGAFFREEYAGNFYIARWLNPEGISSGWIAGAGMSASQIEYLEKSGTASDYRDSFTLALDTGISYEGVQEHAYHREGEQYGYALSLGLPDLGSDFSFTRHALFYRRYQPTGFADSNFNSQLQFKVANGTGATYSLGNSELLRGYDDGYVLGNALLLANLEYHHHVSGYRQLRGVLFTDIGNAWPSWHDIDLGSMETAVGAGLRWRVQTFVDLTLRLDYGYALSTGTTKVKLNTKASF